jgi:hypothetical protein
LTAATKSSGTSKPTALHAQRPLSTDVPLAAYPQGVAG